jgi:hypothetical protein
MAIDLSIYLVCIFLSQGWIDHQCSKVPGPVETEHSEKHQSRNAGHFAEIH